MKLSRDRIALSNFPYYKCSLKYALDSLQKMGAQAIELYAVEPHFHLDDSGPAEFRALKKDLAGHGMQAICFTPEQSRYPINIASSNPYGRKRSIATFSKCLECAAELECPIVQFHAGYPLMDESYADAWNRSVESLAYLARLAEGYGVTIAMEFVNMRWKSVLTNSRKSAEMIALINSPNLKGMVDTVCLSVSEETIDDAIANLGANIRHCHFTDGTGQSDTTQHLIPGEGALDLDHMISALAEMRYEGYLAVELLSPYEECAEDAMRKSAEWLRAHLD